MVLRKSFHIKYAGYELVCFVCVRACVRVCVCVRV